jgi:uncharacterized protein (DUF849 family)
MANKGIGMRYFWFSGLVIFTLHAQQPPTDVNPLQKSVDLMQAIAKLQERYKTCVDTNFEAVQAYILQKVDATPSISQTAFGCIIDRENDASILAQLTKTTELLLKMNELEQRLEKTEAALTQNPKNVLELWAEHEVEQEIETIQKEMLESVMQLSYRQTIRTHQKASEIRGALVKTTKS